MAKIAEFVTPQARGYAVSIVGFEEAQTKAYIKQQEQLYGIQGCEEHGAFEALQPSSLCKPLMDESINDLAAL